MKILNHYYMVILLFFIIELLFLSCLHPNEKSISRLSDIKYGDSIAIVVSPSFFTSLDTGFNQENGVNTYLNNIVFYPDQSVSYFFISDDSLKTHNVHTSLTNCITKLGREKDWGVEWGVYQIKDNVINVEMYQKSLMFHMNWEIKKDVYILKGDTLVHKKRLSFGYDGKKQFEIDYEKEKKVYLCVPIESFPQQSNHFLKKQPWIWRNADDWRNYMKSQ